MWDQWSSDKNNNSSEPTVRPWESPNFARNSSSTPLFGRDYSNLLEDRTHSNDIITLQHIATAINFKVEKPTHLLLTCGHGIVREALAMMGYSWDSTTKWVWLKIGYPKIRCYLSASSRAVELGIPCYTTFSDMATYFEVFKLCLQHTSR